MSRPQTVAPADAAPEPIPLRPAQDAAAPQPAAEAPKKKSRRGRNIALMLLVPALLAAGGGYLWFTGGRYVDTDNAYVQQAMVAISPDVSGRIVEVAVTENQTVAAGDVLFRIDPEPYEIALKQAEAAIASARVNVEQLRVAYGTAQAKLSAVQDILDIRTRELDRQTSLTEQGIAAQSTLDDVSIAAQAAENDVALAREGVASAAAALGGDPDIPADEHPAVLSALAQRDAAARNLAKTTVLAPAAGIVSQVASLNVGQFVAPGTTIASLVESGDIWIEANFKETQLAGLIIGQEAEVGIDAYPGLVLHGHVDSIGSATGAKFSLLPAQNATGNWVKVVQRIAVRIAVDREDQQTLRSGMSANVSVDTGKSRLDALL